MSPSLQITALSIALLLLRPIATISQPLIDIYLSNNIQESRGAKFTQVEETHTSHITPKNPQASFKIIRVYNSWGKITSEVKRNSAGGRISETTWEYTSQGSIKKKSSQVFINQRGWIHEDCDLSYNDSTGRIEEITNNFNKQVKQRAKITCDAEGFPVDVRILNNKGILTSIERIISIPASNCIRVNCFNPSEQFQASYNYPIDPKKPIPASTIKREYNDRGDVTIEMLNNPSKMNQGYYHEYEYDSYGNWTEKRTYQCNVATNNKVRNKKLELTVTRKITY